MGEPRDVTEAGDVQVEAEPVDNAEAVEIEAEQYVGGKISYFDILEGMSDKLRNMVNIDIPKPNERNIKALKKFQLEHVKIGIDFLKELNELEMRYEKLFVPLYEKRRQIINAIVIPTDEECELSDSESEIDLSNEMQKRVNKDAEIKPEAPEADNKGFPEFWLVVFKTAIDLRGFIKKYDEPILKHLVDVKAVTVAEPMGFYLEFHFEPNDYFTNTVLTKYFELRGTPHQSDIFSFEGPEIVKSKGCTIDWKNGKNVTLKTIKKKHKRRSGKTVIKSVQNESFFKFFSRPAVPEDEEQELDDEVQAVLKNDYEVGKYIKEIAIPHAALFFICECLFGWNHPDSEESSVSDTESALSESEEQ